MALYKGFVEVSAGGGPTRRYLLDLDLSVLAPGAPVVLNAVDVDDVTPRPDLTVRTTIHATSQTDTRVEIQLKPEPGRNLVQTQVRVFFNTNTVPDGIPLLYPINGTFPVPSSWVYVGYRGDAGQVMPPELTFWLSQRASPQEGAPADDPLARDDVDIVVTSAPVTGPLHLEGGLVEGPLELLQAREPLLAPAFADGALLDIRGIDLEAPVVTAATITVATPSQPTFPLECLWVGIGTDRLVEPPPAPVVALQPTAGSVDVGAHRYKISYKLRNGNETKVGPPSAAITVTDAGAGGRVLVTLPIGPPPPAPPETPDPGKEVTGRRVYRTLASATGDDGEYLFVGEENDNVTTEFPDNVADAALVEPPADRLVVHYSSRLRHDVDGSLVLRDAETDDRYDLVLTNAPTEARVTYLLRPPAGRTRVRWVADAIVDHVELRLPTLASGNFVWGEARLDGVPQVLGGHWFMRGSDQMLVEIGDGTRGSRIPAGAVQRAQVVLASTHERPWRDALRPVEVELVEKWFTPTELDKARLLVAVSDLRYAKVDLGLTDGGAARHARTGEGFVVDVELAQPVPRPHPARLPVRPGRPLRGLVRLHTYDVDGALSDSHVAVRIGDVFDVTHVDVRSSPAEAAGGEYFGAHLAGGLRNVKVLSLTDPSEAAPSWGADALRAWVTVGAVGDDVDIVRTPTDTIVTTTPIVAEASVRHPAGLTSTNGADEPFRHVKGLLSVPGGLRVGPAAVAHGTAGAGTTADTLADGHVVFASSWAGGSVRYLSGALAGQVRTITAVAADGTSATTDAFGAPPAAGDRYVIEVAGFDGLSFVAALDGAGVAGRVAISRDLDRFTAVGATPQLRLRSAPPSPGAAEPTMRSLSGRVYGVRAAGFASDPAGPLSVPVVLDPSRVNKAFRAELRELDTRFAADERDMAKGRLEAVPDDITLRVDLTAQQFEWRGLARSGRLVFFSEPGLMRGPTAGPRAGSPAGIGLVEAEVDGLPRWLRLTVLPSPALPAAELVPRNFTPPAGFTTTGFKAEVSEMASVDFLRMIRWSRDNRDDLNKIYWSHLAATFVRWNQEAPPVAPDPAVLTPVWIWMFGEDDPADEEGPESGLGYRISPPGTAPLGVTMTLDLDSAGLTINDAFAHWRDLADFEVGQELQMENYANEVTVSSTAGGIAGGDDSGGPGEWFLRIIDGRPWYVGFGSAYFGNTGVGSPFTLPRIFT